MSPDAHNPETEAPRAANGAVTNPAAVQNQQPGLAVGVCSIVAGVVGFSIPVLGMIASCAGIWLGVRGFRQGRAGNYAPSIVCAIIGISLSGLGIVFWVTAVLFESYR
jgi:protein-S-isoprenylcysteine O-methyltransferase Ste14